MAASDLHSSPVLRSLHDQLLMLSSSPLFDLNDLAPKKPTAQTLRSGSAAVPVPADATSTFTSASELLRAGRAAGGDSLGPIAELKTHTSTGTKVKDNAKSRATIGATKTSKAAKAPKRVAKAIIILSSDDATSHGSDAVSDTRTAQVNEGDASIGQKTDSVETEARSWNKFKSPVSPALAPTLEGKAGSEKAKAKPKVKRKTEKSEVVSKHFSKKDTGPSEVHVKGVVTKATRAPSPEPINLEPAVQRRLDWTPPRPDTQLLQTDLLNTSADFFGDEDGDSYKDANDFFKQLRDKFGHMESIAAPIASDTMRTAYPLGKRRAIEMISVNEPAAVAESDYSPSPAKQKAPKKPRTITEVAMAAYQIQPIESTQISIKDKSLLDHFNLQNPDNAARDSKTKAKAKASKVTKRTKKAAPKQPELLSPRAAMRQSAAQDFVFGTSSQLAHEQSPTFLKELNAALRASNRTSEDDLSTDALITTLEATKHKRSGRGLWSVSARNEGGELVDIEVIDLVDSPAPAFTQNDAILDPWKDLPPPGPTTIEPDETDMSLLEIGYRIIPNANDPISRPSLLKSTSVAAQRKITINSATSPSPEPLESSFPLIEDILADEMPPPSNQQQSLEDSEQTYSPAQAADHAQARPQYEVFTDAKLSKEISRYGFKVVKSRTAMISLLDQCWRSKNQEPGAGALFSTTSAAAASRAKKSSSKAGAPGTTSPAKRAIGRSKKATVAAASDGMESSIAPPAKRARGRPKAVSGTDSVDTEASAVLRSPMRKEADQSNRPLTPVKKRGRPLKDDTSLGRDTTSVSTPSPKRKTARRPAAVIKDSDLDDDDEEDGDVTSPEQLYSPGMGEVSITDDTEVSLNLSPSDLQSALFRHITKAVVSEPRTTDPSKPSWHEKILMYDPIILEDLTAWLNSGQLTSVGHDDEVKPAEVKKWCESRSICCLWRINVHGKERKRF